MFYSRRLMFSVIDARQKRKLSILKGNRKCHFMRRIMLTSGSSANVARAPSTRTSSVQVVTAPSSTDE